MTQNNSSLAILTFSDETLSSTTSTLKAMGNENRVRVLALLHENNEMSVTQLQEALQVLSQSALSQHLAILRNSGLVQTRRDSQTIYYSLSSHIPNAVLNILLSHASHDS